MEKTKENFLEHLKYERNYSDKTILNYEKDLNLFLDFCDTKQVTNFKKVTFEFIRFYLKYLYSLKYSNKTISRHLSSLRSFFKYLLKENIIEVNPCLLVSSPKGEQRLPNFISEIDLEKLFSIPNTDEPLGDRDELILRMFYATGIRLSELANMKVTDIDFYNRRIKILGKGSKERYVLYGDNCHKSLERYLNKGRLKLLKNSTDYLFLNSKGEKLTSGGIEYIINKIVKGSGVTNNHITPHVFRHTFATSMLNEGSDLVTVKELLGHSNLSTTSIYTHVSNEHLRNVYLDSHPRARKK